MNNIRRAHGTQKVGIAAELLAGIGITGWATSGLCAADPHFDLHIGQGNLSDQLAELAEATHTQMLFDDTLIRQTLTHGLQGRYYAEQALTTLIKGTGLVCERIGAAFGIRLPAAKERQSAKNCLRSPKPPRAIEEGPRPSTPDTKGAMSEIEVYAEKTATHLPNGLQVGAEILTFSAQDIRESGAHDTADVLRLLTANFTGGATEDTRSNAPEAVNNSGAGVSGNLRGAGSRATLLLIDGLPVALSGSDASFGDLLQIPLSAIDRIDVLPDGASGIYGAEAVGGVINIHTVSQFVQSETHAELGSVTSGHEEEHRVSHLGGLHWEEGDLVAAVEVSHRGNLPASARWQANADLSPRGPNGDVPYTDPGNLLTPDGPTYRVPNGQPRQPLDFSSLSASMPAVTNPWEDASIVPGQTAWSMYTFLRHRFRSSMSFWVTVVWTQRYAVESWGGQLVGNLDVTKSPFLLHAPPGTTENYNLLDQLGSQLSSDGIRTLNAGSGLQIVLSGSWQLVLRGSAVREWESQLISGHSDKDTLQSAVDSGAYDPLGSGAINTTAALESVETPQRYSSLSELGLLQAVASGEFFDIGAGSWREALGLEYRDQGFRSLSSSPVLFTDLRRQIYAAFIEIEAPLLDAETLPRPLRNLSVSIAGRYDEYSDFGNSAVPRLGFEWIPVDHLKLLGTWGWSVRAPNLGDLSERANASAVYNVGVPILVVGGGNAKLTTERALTRSVGCILTWPDANPRVSLEMRYFGLTYQGRIDQPQLEQNILSDPGYAAYVTLHPTASQVALVCNHTTFTSGTYTDCLQQKVDGIVDSRLHNENTLYTDGIDAQAKLAFDTWKGSAGINIGGTYVLDYQQAKTPQSPLESLLNQESQPLALHLAANAWWQLGGAKAILALYHQNRYRDTETDPITRVGSWTTIDLRLSYTIRSHETAQSHTTLFAAYCENLFNRLPPFSVDTVDNRGYDAENGDLAGRRCTASVHVTW